MAGRGPSHQRWRGAEGRAEQAGWVGSGLRVAMAASTPGRAPLAWGGAAAQSGRRPRPRPARQPSARSRAPAPAPPCPGGRAGSEGGRAPPPAWAGPSAGGAPGNLAARAAGTAGEPQPPPASAPATCALARPAPLRPGGRCAAGPRARSAPPRPGEPTSDPRLTWFYGWSWSLRAAAPGRAQEAQGSALRHQRRPDPAPVVEGEIWKQEWSAPAKPGAAGGRSVTRAPQIVVEVTQGRAPPVCPPRTFNYVVARAAALYRDPRAPPLSPGHTGGLPAPPWAARDLIPEGRLSSPPPPPPRPRVLRPHESPDNPQAHSPPLGTGAVPRGGRSGIG